MKFRGNKVMAPKSRFSDGEKVLCFHGPLLYEAKCQQSEIKEKQMKYFIHYSGWNKNWDEWVPESRILKYNETNLQKQKELIKTHVKSRKAKSIKVAVKKDTEKEIIQASVLEKSVKPRPQKKVSVPSPCEQIPESEVEIKKKKSRLERCFVEEVKPPTEIKIDIPEQLKIWLVDDCDLVTRQKKLLSLPARVTVDHVIAGFVKEKVSAKRLSKSMEMTIVQVANKVRDCFNVHLGIMLLYKFERQQYAEVLSEYPSSSMCQIYGAIHLMRLFTEFGTLLTPLSSTLDLTSLVGHLTDFTKYMSMIGNFFSLDDYVVASPEYQRRAVG